MFNHFVFTIMLSY